MSTPGTDCCAEEHARNHVKNDLDPYVCLFKGCRQPDMLFNHCDEWLSHQSQHAKIWNCSSSHDLRQFSSREEYMQHMRETHMVTMTDSQLRTMANRNTRNRKPLFPSCPLCGEENTIAESMETHIVGHLRYLALRSLPSYEEHLPELMTVSDDSRPNEGSDLQCGSTARGILDDNSASETEVDHDSHVLTEANNNNKNNFLGEQHDFRNVQDWLDILYEGLSYRDSFLRVKKDWATHKDNQADNQDPEDTHKVMQKVNQNVLQKPDRQGFQKTYFILHSFDYAPDGPIQLGQVIENPRRPYRCIAPPLQPYPTAIVHSSVNNDWSFEKSSVSVSVGVFGKFLGAIVGKMPVAESREFTASWSSAKLETDFLDLEASGGSQYVAESIERVAGWKRSTRGLFFKKVVYMVTGVKIARRPGPSSFRTSRNVERSPYFGRDLEIGRAVEVDVQVGAREDRSGGEAFVPSEDFVFAYQLRKVTIRGEKITLGNHVSSGDLH